MQRLVVDGYNLLHADPGLSRQLEEDPDGTRARLVERVAAYCVGTARGTVVFDGGGNPRSDGHPHHVAGVTVIFSPAGESADSVVEALARRGRERGERVTVVTSDAETQWAVFGLGVLRMSSAEFLRLLETDHAESYRDRARPSRRGLLQDRIDPAVRDALTRWARQ